MTEAPPTPPFRLPADATERDLVAKLFRGLGDPLRLAVLDLLVEHGERTVSELVAALGEPQPKVSNHLAALRWCGYVETTRSGRNVRYRVADARIPALVHDVRVVLRDHPEHGAGLPPLPDAVPAGPDAAVAPAPVDEPDEPATPDPALVVEDVAAGEDVAPPRPTAVPPSARAASRPTSPVLVFRLGEGEYGVPVDEVREVVRRVETRTLPGLPADAIGVASHRGVVLQVRDLARRLGVESAGEGRAVLVVDGMRGPVGWRVDRVVGLVQPEDAGFGPPPVGGAHVERVMLVGERIVLVLGPAVLRG